MMKDSRYWALVAKYLTGEASEREIELLKTRTDLDSVCREGLDDAAQAWETAEEDEVHVDVAAAWRRLENKIDEQQIRRGIFGQGERTAAAARIDVAALLGGASDPTAGICFGLGEAWHYS